jgi:hypothetical protein
MLKNKDFEMLKFESNYFESLCDNPTQAANPNRERTHENQQPPSKAK